ncbi:hypothetical protein Fmac_020489 [Flemingia macrophylla]|uniref:Glycosyltransferase N-terminal domain-containing protein n=1 Tax=Flemingia macrophylla TaxID=520843 RepID=A0ABD1LU95_9FABA
MSRKWACETCVTQVSQAHLRDMSYLVTQYLLRDQATIPSRGPPLPHSRQTTNLASLLWSPHCFRVCDSELVARGGYIRYRLAVGVANLTARHGTTGLAVLTTRHGGGSFRHFDCETCIHNFGHSRNWLGDTTDLATIFATFNPVHLSLHLSKSSPRVQLASQVKLRDQHLPQLDHIFPNDPILATLRDNNSISDIHFHFFEVPSFVFPPPNPNNPETNFPFHLLPSIEASSHLREPIRKVLEALSSQTKRVIVVHNPLMASVAQDATNMPNVENYTFHSTCGFTTFVYFWEGMGRPSIEGLRIPEIHSLEGCFTAQFKDFVIAQLELLKFSDGSIVNSSRAIEGLYIKLLEGVTGGKKLWVLGPFNPLAIEKKHSKGSHPCME